VRENNRSISHRRAFLALLLIAGVLLAFRLCHLRADFPDLHFYSQDGARFTDEGFYTGAALHYFTLGHAYLPGGWNPAVFMPVWPLMVGLLFHFTGISVEAARILAVVCTWIGVLLAYSVARQYRSKTFAILTAFLVASNALGFFFGRLAILEPAFVMWLLLAIYLAGRIRPGNYALAVAVGLVFVAATLTKTTAPFVLPAVLYPIWANNRKHPREPWKLLAVSFATIVLLLGYTQWIWLHRYAADFQVVLGLGPRWRAQDVPLRLLRFFFRGTWIDPALFPLALACCIAALSRLRFLWRDTLFATAVLWEAGYAAFIAFHIDGPPRYFVTLIVPTIWLALLFVEWLWTHHRNVAQIVAACVAISVIWNVSYVALGLCHPRYTLVHASREMKHLILSEDETYPKDLLIGHGADQLSLLSGGFPTMDSDGAMPLTQKLDAYQPGWFMRWTSDPPLRAQFVAEKRRLAERAAFPDLNRNHPAGIVLYQLFPRVSP